MKMTMKYNRDNFSIIIKGKSLVNEKIPESQWQTLKTNYQLIIFKPINSIQSNILYSKYCTAVYLKKVKNIKLILIGFYVPT